MSPAYRIPALAPDLPAARMVPPPGRARAVARAILIVLVTFLLAAAIAPWQQSIAGTGRVIAYAPLERRQMVEATIDGRVAAIYVQEGSRVQAGDPLIDLADVDPDRLARAEEERSLAADRVASYEARRGALEERVASVREAQQGAVRAAEARARVASERLAAAEQSVGAADAELDAAALNLTRHRVLVQQGLVSQRDLEVAIAAGARARAGRDGALAQRDAARAELDATRAALEQARAAREAEIESALAQLRSAETDLQSARTALLRAETALARQSSQRVLAPRSGTVLRLAVWQGGQLVKAGDPLLELVPDTAEREVELWVDGNDAALIGPGRQARLQFEGWPAVQFVGWPSVAVGTFGGRVAFVDATDDGRGDFRVVIVPDPDEERWPDPRYLRQGVRANGWVLLDSVPLGYELWRQINGFPQSVSRPPTPASGAYPTGSTAGAGSSGSGYGGSGSAGEADAAGSYGGAR